MMEQVVSCKDEIAQQYLMQCIIQGFPDEFHLGTLSTLLSSLPELQSGVKVHLIVASLLDRLNRCALFSHSPLLSLLIRDVRFGPSFLCWSSGPVCCYH